MQDNVRVRGGDKQAGGPDLGWKGRSQRGEEGKVEAIIDRCFLYSYSTCLPRAEQMNIYEIQTEAQFLSKPKLTGL